MSSKKNTPDTKKTKKAAELKMAQQSEGSSEKPEKTKVSPNVKEEIPVEVGQYELEADRLASKQPLLEALMVLAGHYGRRTSVNALTAGLPITNDAISPVLFVRAAERADLQATLSKKSISALKALLNLPCILVLREEQACILRSIEKDPETGDVTFIMEFPETVGRKRKLTEEQLADVYTGQAYFVRPRARLDDRAGPAEIEEGRDWFWAAIWKNKNIYKEVLVAALFINLFAIASPLFIMNVYDRVIPNQAFESLWVLAIGVTIAFVFDFILKNLRAFFIDIAGRRSDVRISAIIFEQILGMKLASRPYSAGVLVSHMKEFETIRDFFTSATMATIIDLPFSFIFVVIIFVLAGPVALVPLLAMPLVLIVGWVAQKKLDKVIKQSMLESAMKAALMFEVATGLETVKVQAAEGHIQRKWEELCERASKTHVKSREVSSFTTNWASFVQQMNSVVMVVVGTFLFAEQEISLGALIAAVILSGRALAPLAQVAGLLVRYNQTRQAFEQLDDLMAKPVERPKGVNYISKARFVGQIEFNDVTFNYPAQSVPAIKNLSFKIEGGQHIGVIGAVGSGKTTIERLILNLYEPTSGAVLIDNTDVRQIDPGDLRRQIGVVQQDPQLFYGSVRDNITLGHETVSEPAVLKAAKLAGVLDFLRGTEHGLDTQVGERGEALSGGQRQSVAIARALLYDPKILILDEPTASIDPASEIKLKNHLKHIIPGRTVILITHKGTMLDIVDKIILMDKSKIVDFGPRDDVIKNLRSGKYATKEI